MLDFIRSIQSRDPANPTFCEVIFGYAGFHILFFHRIAHWFWSLNLRALARLTAQIGRFFTGIEIHPGATIGKRLFIDHGMGVVIGETAVIGDDVTLYHGVTLGGMGGGCNAPSTKGKKRHPTLKNHVMIGAGAQILGDITLHDCACVGANSVVTSDVPEGTTVIGIPARRVGTHKPGEEALHAYGLPGEAIEDPLVHVINGLVADVKRLERELAALKGDEADEKTVDHPARSN